MRARTALAVLMAVGGITAAGCIPPSTGGGAASTTTVLAPAGCLDATGNDLLYTGTPNVEGNLHMYASTNGTCAGSPTDTTGLVVVSVGEPQANDDCFGHGRDNAIDPTTLGVTLPADHWICTAS